MGQKRNEEFKPQIDSEADLPNLDAAQDIPTDKLEKILQERKEKEQDELRKEAISNFVEGSNVVDPNLRKKLQEGNESNQDSDKLQPLQAKTLQDVLNGDVNINDPKSIRELLDQVRGSSN